MSLFNYVRMMDEADLHQVHQIEQQAYEYPWSLQGFEKSLDQGLNYIFCDQNGNMLGYCCTLTVLDEAHILNICVAPQFQRQGIAIEAMQKIIEAFKESDFEIVFLEVRQSNSQAQRLYEKLGFAHDGVRKDYYRAKSWDREKEKLVESKENAILMSYRLNA